jgi:hypothetical protein
MLILNKDRDLLDKLSAGKFGFVQEPDRLKWY